MDLKAICKLELFQKKNQYVPKIDPDYKFDKDTTLAILAGFSFNKRVLIQGYHGTGKSTHIEQVAARLNWPCIRVNLDRHISTDSSETVLSQQRDGPVTTARQSCHNSETVLSQQ